MKNIRIRYKLILGFSLMLLISIIVGTVGIFGMTQISNNEETLYQIGQNTTFAMDLIVNIDQQQIAYRDGLIFREIDPVQSNASLARLSELDRAFFDKFDQLKANLRTKGALPILEEVHRIFTEDFVPNRNALVDSIRNGDLTAARRLFVTLTPVLDRLKNKAEEYVTLATETSAATNLSDSAMANSFLWILIVLLVGSAVFAVVLCYYIAILISRPVRLMAEAAERMSLGDANVQVVANTRDEIGQLSRSFQRMVEAVSQQASTLEAVATGDYTVSIPIRSEQDLINRAIGDMLNHNHKMLTEIRDAAEQVSAGAQQIAQASQNLATGSTEQAATISDFSENVSEIQEKSENNADMAHKTLEDIREAGRFMSECTESMREMLRAMHGIDESSKNISKVIRVIDDIAFQTNILALNAAVEAARAGSHGKGFAVVAEEVRSLASKSAAAAKETSDLIERSLQSVSEGNNIVEKTNESLQAVSIIASKNAESISSINDVSREQSLMLAHITAGISQLSTVVQANSATAEETAAAAEEMSAQSVLLNGIVGRFRLHDNIPVEHASSERHSVHKYALPEGQYKY